MEISRQTALEILGLTDNFTTDELNKRYRELSKILHPDTGGDENLFKMLTCCKDVLTNHNSQSSSAKASTHSSAQESKTLCYIDLKTLEDIYFTLHEYRKNWDIIEVRSMARVHIAPRWKRKLGVSMNINLTQPFEEFQVASFVNFSETISIPESLKNFKNFNVQVEFMGKTYRFKMSDRKPIHTIKYEHYLKFISLLELKFE